LNEPKQYDGYSDGEKAGTAFNDRIDEAQPYLNRETIFQQKL